MTIKEHGGVFGRNPTFNTVTASQFVGPISGLATSAAALKSSATTGLMQITGPATGQTRTMTIPDANFTAARTDAGQTFTGVQVMTSPNIVTSINDTNGNEVFGITATASAVNELTVANAATGNNPTISATGTDTNIGVTITPKGTGNLVLTTGNFVVANGSGIDFSATPGTGTSTSKLFDDYEEGRFDTVLTDTGATSTISLLRARCDYIKAGRMVHITGEVEISTITGTPSGDIQMTLPFVNATSSQRSARSRRYIAMFSLAGAPTGIGVGLIDSAATKMQFAKADNFVTSNIALNIQSGTVFQLDFTYHSAS